MWKMVAAVVQLTIAFLLTFVVSDPATLVNAIPIVDAAALQEFLELATIAQVLSSVHALRGMLRY